MRVPKTGLYAITDPNLLVGEKLFSGVEDALAGGAVMIQYRDKLASQSQKYANACRLAELCKQYARPLIINDDIELVLAIEDAGLHVGRNDVSLETARLRLGPRRILGATCHRSITRAKQAQAAGADYVAFGRFYPSVTKPEAPEAELHLLPTASRALDLPVVAIGGISITNAASTLAAGAQLVAVIHDLFAAACIRQRAGQYARLFHPTDLQGNAL